MPDPFRISPEESQYPVRPARSLGRLLAVRLGLFAIFLVVAGLFLAGGPGSPIRVPGTPLPAALFLLPLFVFGVVVTVIVTAAGLGVNSARSAMLRADLRRGRWAGTERADLESLLTPVKREPGRMMAVRLRPTVSPAKEVLGLGCVAVFWNTIVSVFVAFLATEWLAGSAPWPLTLFLAPFVIIGAVMLVVLIGKILSYLRVPETMLEMEREPLVPGERVRIHLAQSGQISLNTLTVDLRCLEEIRYTRGTDTYTEARDVYTERLLDTGPLDVGLTRTLEQPLDIRIPEQGPVSFHARHNALIWRLEIGLDVKRWPNARYAFPFRVVPDAVRARL